MWLIELQKMMETIASHDLSFQKVLLKEFFIKKFLFYIYKQSPYHYLIFNGGTCLRIVYDLPRLSEDIDMDIPENEAFDIQVFAEDMVSYAQKQLERKISFSIISA